MKYGEQHIYLNSRCFDNGLLMPVHELLHTLGLPKETQQEPNPGDPLSLGDKVKDFTHIREVYEVGKLLVMIKNMNYSRCQVKLALAYDCADSLTKKNLADMINNLGTF